MNKVFKERKRPQPSGVQEGAPGGSVNIQKGCREGKSCLYCYARYNAVCGRFKYMTQKQWDNSTIDEKKVDAPHRGKYDGVVMFPTTHDITEANISQYCCVLRKLLDAGNKVLIVSKPHLSCIKVICAGFKEHRANILFRFTIGSCRDDVLKFWEPGAPSFSERIACLMYAWKLGFATSISCEPYLDCFPQYVYEACSDFLTDSFWIGKLNHFDSRVNLDGVSKADIQKYVEPLRGALSDHFVRAMVALLKDKPLIRWKCSVRKVIGES